MLKLGLTDKDYARLIEFSCTGPKYFNSEGKILIEQVVYHTQYYDVKKMAALTITHTSPDVPSGSYLITKKTVSFLHDAVIQVKKSS